MGYCWVRVICSLALPLSLFSISDLPPSCQRRCARQKTVRLLRKRIVNVRLRACNGSDHKVNDTPLSHTGMCRRHKHTTKLCYTIQPTQCTIYWHFYYIACNSRAQCSSLIYILNVCITCQYICGTFAKLPRWWRHLRTVCAAHAHVRT